MNVIENWQILIARTGEKDPQLMAELVPIHMGAFDDLRRNGGPIAARAAGLSADERLLLAGELGLERIKADVQISNTHIKIQDADAFPNCIFMAAAAVLENLEGSISQLFVSGKMPCVFEYETESRGGGPLGKILPLLSRCYPWIQLELKNTAKAPSPAAEPRRIPPESAAQQVKVTGIGKLDLARTVFEGEILRGTIKKGDMLSLADENGRVLCEGAVLLLVRGEKELEKASGGTLQILLSAELPGGRYGRLWLVGEAPKKRSLLDKILMK